jgi:hypothetical protein
VQCLFLFKFLSGRYIKFYLNSHNCCFLNVCQSFRLCSVSHKFLLSFVWIHFGQWCPIIQSIMGNIWFPFSKMRHHLNSHWNLVVTKVKCWLLYSISFSHYFFDSNYFEVSLESSSIAIWQQVAFVGILSLEHHKWSP